jgi:hypothetical protein
MLIYQSNPIIDIRISRIFNVEMVSNDLMKQQQEKKVKQFEMVQYNVNFMVVEIIEQLKLDFHSLSCTSKFDVTSEILQTIPPKMLLESCISVSNTHHRAHETHSYIVSRLLHE